MRYATIDGRKIVYDHGTDFIVQSGYGKGSYETRYHTRGNLHQAVRMYKALNVGNGYKKRLIAPVLNKPVLARCITVA